MKVPAFLIIGAVTLISMLAPFTIDTYLPSFPAIESELAVTSEFMMQSLSVYLLVFGAATLFWGPLSDRWGRRKIILISLLGYVLGSFICALTPNFELLMAGRALQGFFAAGSLVASRAMVRDVFDGDQAQKAMAVVMMLFAAAPAFAPILGGWLEVHYGWRWVFLFLMAYGIVIFLLFVFFIPETLARHHVQSVQLVSVMKAYWVSIQDPIFARLIVAQGLLIGGFFLYVAGSSSIIFNHLKLFEQDFWMLFVPVVSFMIVGSSLIHRLTGRVANRKLVDLSLAICFIGILLNVTLELSLSVSIYMVVIPLMFYSMGFAMANPGLMVMGLDCMPERRGMASSMQSFFQMGTAGMVTAVILPYVHHSLLAMAVAQALLFSTAGLLWLSVRSKDKDANSSLV